MDIKPNYNPESSIFTLEFSSNLLLDYFNNLRGMLLDKKDVFRNLEVTRKSINTAKIEFKVSKEEMSRISKPGPAAINSILEDKNIPEDIKSTMRDMISNSEMEVSVMTVDANDTTNPFGKVNNVINKFITEALKARLKTTEFLPLKNYDDTAMKEDALAALESKRNFCIVDDFENYKKEMRSNTYNFTQYSVKYGTSEYADIVLMLVNGEFNELRKRFENKLEVTSWV